MIAWGIIVLSLSIGDRTNGQSAGRPVTRHTTNMADFTHARKRYRPGLIRSNDQARLKALVAPSRATSEPVSRRPQILQVMQKPELHRLQKVPIIPPARKQPAQPQVRPVGLIIPPRHPP